MVCEGVLRVLVISLGVLLLLVGVVVHESGGGFGGLTVVGGKVTRVLRGEVLIVIRLKMDLVLLLGWDWQVERVVLLSL